MNLVDSILERVSGEALNKLSSLVNADGATTRTAVSAAVPTILASLANLAGTRDGANKLVSALEDANERDTGDFSQALGGDTSSWVKKGGDLLSSLLGAGMSSNIASAIGRFAGLGGDSSKSLLGALFPAILGIVARQWKTRGGTIGALTSLFADQKRNIAAAMPDGFSLASIPGLEDASERVHAADDRIRSAGERVRDDVWRDERVAAEATKSSLAWLAPLAALLLAVAGLWWFMRNREQQPVAANNAANPEVARPVHGPETRVALRPETPTILVPTNIDGVTNELKGVFKGVQDDLSSVRDAASATAAMPRLTALNSRIDSVRAIIDKMPQAGQDAVGKIVEEQSKSLNDTAAKVKAMAGTEKIRPLIDEITVKLSGLNLAGVSRQASDIVASLTKSLEGIKDLPSAQRALPELEKISFQIDELSKVRNSMSPGGQSMIASLLSAALGQLEKLVTTVTTQLGADAGSIKPMLDDILAKVSNLSNPPA